MGPTQTSAPGPDQASEPTCGRRALQPRHWPTRSTRSSPSRTSRRRAAAPTHRRSAGSSKRLASSGRLIASAPGSSNAPRSSRGVRRRRPHGTGTSQRCARSRRSAADAAGRPRRSPTGFSAAASRPTGPRRSRTRSSIGSGDATTSRCARKPSGGCFMRVPLARRKCCRSTSRIWTSRTSAPRAIKGRRHRMAAPSVRLGEAAPQTDRRPTARPAVPRRQATCAGPDARRCRRVPGHRPRPTVLPTDLRLIERRDTPSDRIPCRNRQPLRHTSTSDIATHRSDTEPLPIQIPRTERLGDHRLDLVRQPRSAAAAVRPANSEIRDQPRSLPPPLDQRIHLPPRQPEPLTSSIRRALRYRPRRQRADHRRATPSLVPSRRRHR